MKQTISKTTGQMTGQNENPFISYLEKINPSETNDSADQIAEIQNNTLKDIQDLQRLEKDYYQKLTDGLTNGTVSDEDKTYYMEKIDELSKMRINLYKNLNNTFHLYHTGVVSTVDTFVEETAALKIVDEEIKDAQRKLALIQEDQIDKMRQAEISRYYTEKYMDQTSLLKWIILFSLPLIGILILRRRGVIPQGTANILLIFFAVVAVIVLYIKFRYSYTRSNMVYDQFDFKAPSAASTSGSSTDPWNNPFSDISSCLTKTMTDVESEFTGTGTTTTSSSTSTSTSSS
jgi:hypothetical protein